MRKPLIILTATSLTLSGVSLAVAQQNTSIGAGLVINTTAEVPIAERVETVRARGGRNDNRREVYEDALYKAAKKTRKEDYDWFRIIESHIEREVRRDDDRGGFETRYERVPYARCGLLTCQTGYRTERRTDFSADFGGREETRFEVELSFEMGWGAMPTNGDVYDARATKARFK